MPFLPWLLIGVFAGGSVMGFSLGKSLNPWLLLAGLIAFGWWMSRGGSRC